MLLGPVRALRWATLSCGLMFLFSACGSSDNTAPRGGGGNGGAAGHGGSGGGGHDGGAGAAGTPDGGGDTSADTAAPDGGDGGQGLAWRALLPLAMASAGANGGATGTSDDTSGNGYNATYFGPGVTFANDAMSLLGTGTETVVIPAKGGAPVIDVRGSYSVSAWVTLSDVTGYRTVVGGEGFNISSFFLQKRGDSNAWAFTVPSADAASAPACIATSTVIPVANTQYHLVATRDGTSGQNILYVDGVETARSSCPSGWADTGIMAIGHGVFLGNRVDRVAGSISRVGLIDRVLSPAEIADIYAQGRPAAGDAGADADMSGDAMDSAADM